ncbi:hypothetical protein HDU93_000501 [Gonapodya sp. JEL0774]|nr:hypothetical protein HDU93_000501 [Gonapodya sp. JEL0774]
MHRPRPSATSNRLLSSSNFSPAPSSGSADVALLPTKPSKFVDRELHAIEFIVRWKEETGGADVAVIGIKRFKRASFTLDHSASTHPARSHSSPQTTTCTALTYFHRYTRFFTHSAAPSSSTSSSSLSVDQFMRQSLVGPQIDKQSSRLDDCLIGTAAVSLACKATEQMRKVRDVVNVAWWVVKGGSRGGSERYLPINDTYHTLRDSLVSAELALLRVLRFDVSVDLPHRHVAHMCHLLWCRVVADAGGDPRDRGDAMLGAEFVSGRNWRPEVVAACCVFLAGRELGGLLAGVVPGPGEKFVGSVGNMGVEEWCSLWSEPRDAEELQATVAAFSSCLEALLQFFRKSKNKSSTADSSAGAGGDSGRDKDRERERERRKERDDRDRQGQGHGYERSRERKEDDRRRVVAKPNDVMELEWACHTNLNTKAETMKYLDDEVIERMNAAISSVDAGDHRIYGRIESYSCECSQLQSSLGGEDERLLNFAPPVRLHCLANVTVRFAPAFAAGSAGTIEPKAEPMTDVDRDPVQRKTFFYLVATLNAAYPDYDFSDVPPSTFLRLPSAARTRNSLLSSFPRTVHGVSLLDALFRVLDDEIDLEGCEGFRYEPEGTEGDPYGELSVLPLAPPTTPPDTPMFASSPFSPPSSSPPSTDQTNPRSTNPPADSDDDYDPESVPFPIEIDMEEWAKGDWRARLGLDGEVGVVGQSNGASGWSVGSGAAPVSSSSAAPPRKRRVSEAGIRDSSTTDGFGGGAVRGGRQLEKTDGGAQARLGGVVAGSTALSPVRRGKSGALGL